MASVVNVTAALPVVVVVLLTLSSSRPTWYGAVLSPGGTAATVDTVVRLATRAVHPAGGRLVITASISPASGAEGEFGRVSAIASDVRGHLFVADERIPIVRQFSPDGKFVRALGREGRGPGEYLMPRGIAILTDGRIAVHDEGNRRINVYSADGKPIVSWDAPGAGVVRRTIAPTPDGGLVLLLSGQGVRRPPVEDLPERPIVVRYSPDGRIAGRQPMPRPTGASPFRRIGSSTSLAPFAPQRLAVWSPMGYFITAFPARYSFELLENPSRTISIRRVADPVPVSPQEKEAAEAYTDILLTRVSRGQPIEPGPPLPPSKPFFKRIGADADGRIWVQVYAPASPTGPKTREDPRAHWVEPRLFDLFLPDGKYLGRIDAGTQVNLDQETARGDALWTYSNDDDGFVVLNRMRIVWN